MTSGSLAACNKALAKAERIFGAKSADDARAVGCVFDALRGNDPKAALPTAERALETCKPAARCGLSEHARRPDEPRERQEALGDHAGALPLWNRALAGETELFGAESQPVMNLLHDRALAKRRAAPSRRPRRSPRSSARSRSAKGARAARYAARRDARDARVRPERAPRCRSATQATYDRVIELYEHLDDPMGLARTLYNAGDELAPTTNATRGAAFRRAAKVARDTGQKTLMEAACQGALADCLATAHDSAPSDAAFTDAIAMLDTIGNPLFGAQTRWNFADSLAKRRQRARALELAPTRRSMSSPDQPPPAADCASRSPTRSKNS